MSRTDAPPDIEAERAEPDHGAELSPEEMAELFDQAEADAAAAEQKAAEARALADRLSSLLGEPGPYTWAQQKRTFIHREWQELLDSTARLSESFATPPSADTQEAGHSE